jgi:hypothetical protein
MGHAGGSSASRAGCGRCWSTGRGGACCGGVQQAEGAGCGAVLQEARPGTTVPESKKVVGAAIDAYSGKMGARGREAIPDSDVREILDEESAPISRC